MRDGIWTCSGSPAVAGYVSTGYVREGCSGIGAWRHQVARDRMWICKVSPVPAGYRTSEFDAQLGNGIGSSFLTRV